MASDLAKEKNDDELLAFEKRKWEDELEEKRSRRKIDEKKQDIERAIAKVALIKSLKEIGMSNEEIVEQVKEL